MYILKICDKMIEEDLDLQSIPFYGQFRAYVAFDICFCVAVGRHDRILNQAVFALIENIPHFADHACFCQVRLSCYHLGDGQIQSTQSYSGIQKW